MEKLEIGTKVEISLNSNDAHSLGISGSVDGRGVITGHYPLGQYVQKAGRKPMAIADKYEALTVID